MSTQYQKVIGLDGVTISSVFDTINMCFIPLDARNPAYQTALSYLAANNLTIDQLDLYQ